MISCPHCTKAYITLAGMHRHLVAKHGYFWFDNLGVVSRKWLEENEPEWLKNYDRATHHPKGGSND